MRILGVDPGAYGAISLVEGVSLVSIVDMPILTIRRGKSDKAEIDGYHFFRDRPVADVAYIELVGGITGQSASAAFNFGVSCGIVRGAFQTCGIRVEMVAPGTWRRALGVNPGKDGSRALAMRLWPSMAHLFTRKKDADRAESALIAEYGRRRETANSGVSNDIFA